MIDGFNALTTIEAALGGGVVLLCRDTTYRDIAGIHGTYRKVAETLPALEIMARVLADLSIARVVWLFDRPVSNSGRIRSLVLQIAAEHAYDWSVDLVNNPDGLMKESPEIIATADSGVLDAGPRWFNLARHVVERGVPFGLDCRSWTVRCRIATKPEYHQEPKMVMNQEPTSPSGSPARNWPARASWISSLVFLLPSLIILAQFVVGASSPPTLQNAAEAAFEISFLCFPLFYVAGLLPMALGAGGLVAARRLPGKCGEGESIAGILLGLILLISAAVNLRVIAAGFKQ